jgi:hypothetical protein
MMNLIRGILVAGITVSSALPVSAAPRMADGFYAVYGDQVCQIVQSGAAANGGSHEHFVGRAQFKTTSAGAVNGVVTKLVTHVGAISVPTDGTVTKQVTTAATLAIKYTGTANPYAATVTIGKVAGLMGHIVFGDGVATLPQRATLIVHFADGTTSDDCSLSMTFEHE